MSSLADQEKPNGTIGPSLPPHLLNKDDSSPSKSINQMDTDQSEKRIIGPALPPHLSLNKQCQPNTQPSESKTEPETHSTTTTTTIGPSLPSHLNPDSESEDDDRASPVLCTSSEVNQNVTSSSSVDAYGPALPPHLRQSTSVPDSDSDEDIYGPLPPGISAVSQARQALEERALQIKLGHLDSREGRVKSREEWMTELPDVRVAAGLGLGPRQFRKNALPDFSDRSSWTDTPKEKAKKSLGKREVQPDLKKEAELREIARRDVEQAEMAEKHTKRKKRDRSLLEMHRDKLKKKKEEEDEAGLPTRRPFSRDIDLKVNQFDEAQKKSIMKKAMHLDDRFSKGQSKYL